MSDNLLYLLIVIVGAVVVVFLAIRHYEVDMKSDKHRLVLRPAPKPPRARPPRSSAKAR